MVASVNISADFIREAALQPGIADGLRKVANRIAKGAAKEYAKEGLSPNVTVVEGQRPGSAADGFRRPYANVVVDDPKAEYGDERRPPVRALLKAGETYA